MTSDRDHYQQDGFKEVGPFSRNNIFVAILMLIICALIALDLWLSTESQDVEVKEEVVIPWKSHPPAGAPRVSEPIIEKFPFEDGHGL